MFNIYYYTETISISQLRTYRSYSLRRRLTIGSKQNKRLARECNPKGNIEGDSRRSFFTIGTYLKPKGGSHSHTINIYRSYDQLGVGGNQGSALTRSLFTLTHTYKRTLHNDLTTFGFLFLLLPSRSIQLACICLVYIYIQYINRLMSFVARFDKNNVSFVLYFVFALAQFAEYAAIRIDWG